MKNVILGKNMLRSLVLTASLLVSAFSAQAGIILSFGEDDIEVRLNETFTVELYADTGSTAVADGIGNFMLDLNFDNSILSQDSFNLGPLFGIPTDFGGTFTPIFSGPVPTLAAIGNNILLGTFTFTATNYGATSLSTITESFQNLLIGTLEFEESASANISVVSAPATLGLFAIALVGLVSLRRKA